MSEKRIGNPIQQHGEGGHFAKGQVTGAVPYAPAQAKTAAEALPSWLTDVQQVAVQTWLSDSQKQIQKAAAGDSQGEWADIIKNLDQAIEAAPVLAADTIVYREFPSTEKWVLTGILRAPGFTATSPRPLSPTAAHIMVPAGSRALALPGELLLPRGTQFRVDSLAPGHAPQLTVFSGSAGDAPKIEKPEAERQLARYRMLWLLAETDEQRSEISEAAKRIGGVLRP